MEKYRAAFYIRVSTDEQAKEGFSLAAQEERCRSFIESQGWTYTQSYVDDGYSAKDINRPAIQKLIHDLNEDVFDIVVVYRLDRLVRSVLDLHHLLNLFDKHKVLFKSVTEVFDTTTAMGRFFITLVGSMAQWERENLAERVIMGMEKKVMEGKRNGSYAPYGYYLEDNQLFPQPEEAKIVKEIFEMYIKMGALSIARNLNSRGLRTRNGSQWSSFTLNHILKNPVYIGKIRWGYSRKSQLVNEIQTEGNHEAIISIDLFEQVQTILKKRSETHMTRSVSSTFIFSGIIRCPKCGSRMIGSFMKKRNHKYYICSQKKTHGTCKMRNINELAIEQVLFHNFNWQAIFMQRFKPEEDPGEFNSEQKHHEITQEIEKIKKRLKKWHVLWANEEIGFSELKEYTQEDKQRLSYLEKQLDQLPDSKVTKTKITEKEFMEMLNNIKEVWTYAEVEEKKELVASFLSKVAFDFVSEDENYRGVGKIRPVKLIDFELV